MSQRKSCDWIYLDEDFVLNEKERLENADVMDMLLGEFRPLDGAAVDDELVVP